MKVLKLVFFLALLQSCNGQSKKINGLSFVSSNEPINESHIKPAVNTNANYMAIMPFGFIKNLEHPEVIFNTDRQWYGETKIGTKQYISQLQKKNLKIMVKPQIWVWRGEYTGYIEMISEENWKILEESYSEFIIEYARLAHEVDAEILCIGTELGKFITHRPEYWNSLINTVKAIYKGKLTYAANWDEFKNTPFWNKLDYVGVNAYFPVSDIKTPSVEDCKIGWKEHKKIIKNISNMYNKPILFTEFGYRSVDYTGKEPWKSDKSMNTVNLNAQVNATQAIFEEFWGQDWFAGGFLWKWFHDHEKYGGTNNSRFTPQNKPAEVIIKEQYANYN